MPSISDSLELTPKDLRNFNKKMTDEILQAQKDGWRGHVNRQGHVSMLAPDGKDTVVVSANENAVNQLMLGINRYRRRQGETVEVVKEKTKVIQKWPCARPNCPKVYASEEHLNLHIAVDHEKRIKCPDCNETFKAANVVGRHRQLKHGYESPNKAKRKQQEANRAKKKLNEEGKLTEEQRETIKTYLEEEAPKPTSERHEYVPGSSKLIDDHILRHAGRDLPSPEDIKALMEEGTMTKEEAEKLLHASEHQVEPVQNAGADGAGEARKSIGRAIKDHMFRNVDPSGVKFDPHFVDRMIAEAPAEPVMDTMDAKSLVTGKEHSLKEIEINQHVSITNNMSVADIYRQTTEQLKRATEAIKKVKQPQSIMLDLEQIMDMDIRSVARVLKAAGMSLKVSSVPIEGE